MTSYKQWGSRSPRQRLRRLALKAVASGYPRVPSVAPVRSVLLIRPDHLGDVLLLTPALRALRRALPRAHIALAVGPWSADAVRNNDDIDEVVIVAFPGFERRAKRGWVAPYRTLFAEAQKIRMRGVEAAAVMRFDHWWGAWLAAAAGIPRRIGYRWPEVIPFLTQVVPYVSGRHEVLQNGGLLQALSGSITFPLGPTRFVPSDEDRRWADMWLHGQGVAADERLVAIHPGAGAAVKQWPVERWARVGLALHEQGGARLLVTGGEAERDLARSLNALLPSTTLDAAGATSLGQLAALYGRCAAVLGSDSGPLHLAVATGRPTVHLYGPVPAAKFGPWGDPQRQVVIQSRWACAPCDRLDWPVDVLADHGCVATIEPQRVIEAALSLLGGP